MFLLSFWDVHKKFCRAQRAKPGIANERKLLFYSSAFVCRFFFFFSGLFSFTLRTV
jgi:hypothetical protein